LPGIFQSASVATMPYTSSTGSSGVAHLACAYGVPIVCADLPDFRQMADGEELAIEFYRPGSVQGLAGCLIRLLQNPARQQEMAVQNFSAALRMTMPMIVQKYLRHFELEQRTEALRQVTRFRRLPSWVPSKSLLLRMMTRNSSVWVHRAGIQRLPVRPPNNHLRGNQPNGQPSLNRDLDNSGELTGTRVPLDGDGVNAGRGRSRADGVADRTGSTVPSAGNRNHGSAGQTHEQNHSQKPAPVLRIPREGKAHETEGQ